MDHTTLKKLLKRKTSKKQKRKWSSKKKELTKHLNKKESPQYRVKGNDTIKNVTSKKWVNNKTFNKKE